MQDMQEIRVWPLGQERSPGEENSNPLQCCWLEISMDRGAWWATIHGVSEWDMTEWLSTITFDLICLCAQPRPTPCDPTDCSLPGSSVRGIPQARALEWVAISSSRGFSWPRDRSCVSCIDRRFLYWSATWGRPKSRIAGSYGNSIFSFQKNLHTAFHNGRTSWHIHQQCTRVLLSPQPLQNLLWENLF